MIIILKANLGELENIKKLRKLAFIILHLDVYKIYYFISFYITIVIFTT